MTTFLNVISEITMDTLNRYASRKKKYVGGNRITFLKKDFAKAIMERTRLKNKHLQSKIDRDKKLCFASQEI